MTHMMLPTPVANMLKKLMKPTLNPGTRSLTMLQELGVLAVGFVGVEDHERVLFMPGAPESRRLDMKKRLRIMMAEYECEQEERNEVAKPGCTALVVYFDTEEGIEPTAEVGKVLNTNFALIMLSQARDEGILLEATHMQMLEDHERRRGKLELAEDTLETSYEFVDPSPSWMSSSGAGSPGMPGPPGICTAWLVPPGSSPSTSNVCSQPSTTTSLREVMACTLLEGEISPSFNWQGTTSEVLGPPSETTSLREENAGALEPTTYAATPRSHGARSAQKGLMRKDFSSGSGAPEPEWLQSAAEHLHDCNQMQSDRVPSDKIRTHQPPAQSQDNAPRLEAPRDSIEELMCPTAPTVSATAMPRPSRLLAPARLSSDLECPLTAEGTS
jgi:hypothetical protein